MKLNGEDYLGGDHLFLMKHKLMLGDYVEKVAQPIAKMIDSVAGTSISTCASCKKRKERLNSLGEKIMEAFKQKDQK